MKSNTETLKEPVVVWQQQSGERSSKFNDFVQEPVNYIHSLCYDNLTQDKFYKTESTPTLNQTENNVIHVPTPAENSKSGHEKQTDYTHTLTNHVNKGTPLYTQTELTSTTALHDQSDTSTVKYNPRNKSCALRCSEPPTGMPNVTVGSSSNPSKPERPGTYTEVSSKSMEHNVRPSNPECNLAQTDDPRKLEKSDTQSHFNETDANPVQDEKHSNNYDIPTQCDKNQAEKAPQAHFGISTSNNSRAEKCPPAHPGTSNKNHECAEKCPPAHPGTQSQISKCAEKCPPAHPGTFIQKNECTEGSRPVPKETSQAKQENQICTTTLPNNPRDIFSENLTQINTVDTSNQKYVPPSTNLWLRQKRKMLYFPMNFGEITIDGIVDTGIL